jgi:fructose-1,6-bisphosphatase/inositol monophosphatase family enzyme
MTSPHPSRSVDVAAAQLIAREAGALVELGEGDLSTIGLGLEKRFPVMGSTSAGGLEIVRRARPAA